MKKQVHLIIHGLVQGIGFRYHILNYAKTHQIFGYVKNTDNGAVEIVAEGEENSLKDLIEWCYNGVVMAEVEKIDVQWSKAADDFGDFRIKY